MYMRKSYRDESVLHMKTENNLVQIIIIVIGVIMPIQDNLNVIRVNGI